MKKFTALFIALAAALSITACSADEQSSSREHSKRDESSSRVTAEESDADSPKPAESTESDDAPAQPAEPSESEAEPAGPVADTAYWDLLCAEYDRCYDNTPQTAILKDGKLMGTVTITRDSKVYWGGAFSYDTSTKQVEYPNEQLWTSLVFINGKIYSPYLEGDFFNGTRYYKCYDLNVNELAKSEPLSDNKTIDYVSEDGKIFTGLDYFSPDLSEHKTINLEISYDFGHGKTETFTNYANKGVYDNKLYLVCSATSGEIEYHTYDLNTGKTEKIDESTNLYSYIERGTITGKYGKYCFSEKGILDIETDEIISDMNPTKNNCKLVGHSMFKTFKNKDGNTEVYKFVLPKNWNEFSTSADNYIKEYGTLVYTSENELDSIDFLTEDYAIIQDKAGCFLIDLTDGSETEFVIPE